MQVTQFWPCEKAFGQRSLGSDLWLFWVQIPALLFTCSAVSIGYLTLTSLFIKKRKVMKDALERLLIFAKTLKSLLQ